MQPFNIDLLLPKKADLKLVGEVKAPDIFVGHTRDFHPEGLFSIETFGKPGTERRNQAFGFIDLGVEVLHPILFRTLCELKELYGEILSGKTYAVFDAKLKDFVKSELTQPEARTGYNFFMKHYKDIVFEERKSDQREFNIKLHEKYKDNATVEYVVVLPAGLRDLEVSEDGRPSEDEVNKLYRKLLALGSMAKTMNKDVNAEYLNKSRYDIQLTFNEIHNYFMNFMDGKNKLIMGKWASRKVFDSTRNVITSLISDASSLDDPRLVGCDQTVVGMFQFLRATMPVTVYKVRSTFLDKVFTGPSSPAYLVNKTTLKKEMVNISAEHYDSWMTYDGIEHQCALFEEESMRHQPLMVGKYYMGLLYKGPDMTYRFLQDMDELPEGFDKKYVAPITLAEFLYLSVFRDSEKIPCFCTRYPVANFGGIYPSMTYLKSTTKSHVRKQLGDDWQPTGLVAGEFPILGQPFFESQTISNMHIARAQADFDGDMMNYTALLTEDAQSEITKLLDSRDFYVDMSNQINFNPTTDALKLLFDTITG